MLIATLMKDILTHLILTTDSCSDELQMNRSNGAPRTIQASIETEITRDYIYQHHFSHDRIERLAVTTMQPQLNKKKTKKQLIHFAY